MKSVGTPFRPRASLNAILILQYVVYDTQRLSVRDRRWIDDEYVTVAS